MATSIPAGLKITAIPVLRDNYVWCLDNGQQAVLVDPGDAPPVLAFLQQHALALAGIWLTHHHADHVGGVAEILAADNLASQAVVYGPAAELIPTVRQPLLGGEQLLLWGLDVQVLPIAAHTRGHLAYHLPAMKALFCGDTLFGAGCGRLFEGTPDDLFTALSRLRALPNETQVYCAHEYTLANLKFAQTVEPQNGAIAQRIADTEQLRMRGLPSLPSSLGLERETNPFLRWDAFSVQQAAQSFDPTVCNDIAVLGALRRWKDGF